MTITAAAITVEQDDRPALRREGLLRPAAAAAGVAAVANALVAAVARAADVPVAIEGEEIPVAGFAVTTLVCSALGLLLAFALKRWAPSPQKAFLGVAVALTALSFVPSVTADADTATKVVLVTTHLVAAAIVIPTIARSLPRTR